jgi:hypothetical protein
MPFCPDCKAEYLESENVCEDCGISLVEALSEEDDEEEVELAEVWCAPNEIEAQMIKALLEGNRIKCILSGETLRLTHGIMVDGLAEVKIIVRADEAGRAGEIIEEYRKDRGL